MRFNRFGARYYTYSALFATSSSIVRRWHPIADSKPIDAYYLRTREPNYIMLFECYNCLTTGSVSRNQEQQKLCSTRNTNGRRKRGNTRQFTYESGSFSRSIVQADNIISKRIFKKKLKITVFARMVIRGLLFFKPIQTEGYY